mmetsp:Transcript_73777/g.130864  ORF Transcript_73777/g.130864 Transcript_73777/m.130864 type:complete len:352 (-) Transcript_73777:8-1063(-)
MQGCSEGSMPRISCQLLRSNELRLIGDVLVKWRGQDGSWDSNALFSVEDPKHFRVTVRPTHSRWSETAPVLVGIAPCDANMALNQIEMHTGVFLLMGGYPAIVRPAQEILPFRVPGYTSAFTSAARPPLQLTYEDGTLYLAFDGYPCAPVQGTIPPADYRPCISIGHFVPRFTVAIDTPRRPGRQKSLDEGHPAKLAKNLWTDRKFADAVVVCGTCSIPVHRCVLAAASPFFARAFEGCMRESHEAKVVIEDIDARSLEALLAFLYTGLADGQVDAASLLPVAHRLEVSGLVDYCAGVLAREVSEENIAGTVATLQPYRDDAAVKPHWDVIRCSMLANEALIDSLMAGLKR